MVAAIGSNFTGINNEGLRVAGTGPYTKKIGPKIAHGTVFNQVISNREPVILGTRISLK